MLPYWDWTDPTGTIVVEDFLGPNGDPLSSNQVRLGYFAADAPGIGREHDAGAAVVAGPL